MINQSQEKTKNKPTSIFVRKFISPLEEFMRLETSSGIFLLIVTLFTLFWANSPWKESYFHFIHIPIGVHFSAYTLEKSLQHWVNDGLMVIFFFVVGLEIKRELVIGELSSKKKAALPFFAAFGGMVFPALIYLFFNHEGETIKGWGVPMATDIAFAVGILSLMSRRVPFSLKIFLLALAIIDDLGAVFVIAFFYTEKISPNALGSVALSLGLISLLKFSQVRSISVYIFLGIINWFAFLKSGIHPTVSGVILGLLCPMDLMGKENRSPLDRLFHFFHLWVSFFIMPIFALTNAGVLLQGAFQMSVLTHPISLGIFLGLVLGKPLGVVLFSFLSVKMNFASLPKGVNWLQISCVGVLSGIGFTMAIFISNLAFKNLESVRIFSKFSILLASAFSALLGLALLFLNRRKK